jgi:alkylation response protein AidB-like acyl-CoA dehydrogenase
MTDTAQDLLFDLTLTDEQRMNRESMQRFAAAEIRTLAKPIDEGLSPAQDFYPKTAELGLTLLPISEALGGAGVDRSPTSNALIFEDLSHGDMSLALGSIVPMAFVNTLLDQGSDAERLSSPRNRARRQQQTATVTVCPAPSPWCHWASTLIWCW